MSFNLYKKIIDQIYGKVYDVNLFHRGEPLLNKKAVSMIAYAVSKQIKTRIHTNATLLNRELSKKIILAGLDLISFSFDGYTKKIYEKNRQGAKFEQTLANIIDFLKMKKQLNSKKPYTIVQVIQDNEGLSPGEISGQKAIFLQNFENLPLNKLVSRAAHNWGGLLEIKGSGSSRVRDSKVVSCTFPWYSLTIFYDGKIFLCPQDFKGKICIGNLNKDNIEEVFNGEKIKEKRKKFKEGIIEENTPCGRCDRIRRKTFMGVPVEYLGIFMKENLRN